MTARFLLLVTVALAGNAWSQHSNGYVFAGPGAAEGTATLQGGIGANLSGDESGLAGRLGR